ncbi:MAG: hypothetical protein Q8P13_02560 [bacterium]|nr:hypothetical protein [bacterium]
MKKPFRVILGLHLGGAAITGPGLAAALVRAHWINPAQPRQLPALHEILLWFGVGSTVGFFLPELILLNLLEGGGEIDEADSDT